MPKRDSVVHYCLELPGCCLTKSAYPISGPSVKTGFLGMPMSTKILMWLEQCPRKTKFCNEVLKDDVIVTLFFISHITPRHKSNMKLIGIIINDQIFCMQSFICYQSIIINFFSDWKESDNDIWRLQNVLPVFVGILHHGDAERDDDGGDGGRQKGRLSAELFHFKTFKIIRNHCI